MWNGGELKRSYRDIQINLCMNIMYSDKEGLSIRDYVKKMYPSWNANRLAAMCKHIQREGMEAFNDEFYLDEY